MTNREIDATVAERIMGWQRFPYQMPEAFSDITSIAFVPPGERIYVANIRDVPHYTTDAAAAFQVVDAMIRKGMPFGMDTSGTTYEAYFKVRGLRHSWKSTNPATAICRAALNALGIHREEV